MIAAQESRRSKPQPAERKTRKAPGRVWSEPVSVDDGGQPRSFVLALDEVMVRGADGDDRLEAVSASSPDDLQAAIDAMSASTGETVVAVLYPQDVERNNYSRRLLSPLITVKLSDGADAAAIAAQVGAVDYEMPDYAPGFAVVRTSGGLDTFDTAEMLRGLNGVEFAEVQLASLPQKKAMPNDTLINQQWHHKFNNQSGAVSGTDINVENVWAYPTVGAGRRGRGIIIGIVDDGVQVNHPDLAANVDLAKGRDWNGNDNDPSPGPGDDHGTCCAGDAAAVGNNNLGVSGSAPEAKLVGMRLTAAAVTDSAEAQAMNYLPQDIQILNNSWGPEDDGIVLEAPGTLTRAALQTAATSGRGGRGTISMWAGGNGLGARDNSNADGYANSIYTIAVSAYDSQGRQAGYSEPGANIVVTSPSDGIPPALGKTTTDRTGADGYVSGDYESDFGGTSSATPTAAGVVALMLEANPNLGWRDVQEILMRSAKKVNPSDTDWKTPVAPANINHSHKFGAGLIDAQAAVTLAQGWTNLGAQTSRTASTTGLPLSIPDNNATGISRTFSVTDNLRVEHVTVTVSATHAYRGDLVFVLTSPAGTKSTLINRAGDNSTSGYTNWTFSSVRHWGESAAGTWTLTVSDAGAGDTGSLTAASLTVFGTGSSTSTETPFSGTFTFPADSAVGNVSSFEYNGSPIANVTVGAMTKVGLTTSPSVSNFRATGFPLDGTPIGGLTGQIDTTKYFEFTITAAPGSVIDLPSITFGIGRSATGPRQWQWRSSVDNFNSAIPVTTLNAGLSQNFGVITNPDSNSNWTGNVIQTSGASYQNLTSITFRLYGYNSESASGTGGLQGPLTFGGTLRAGGSSSPSITSFAPAFGLAGTSVTITGTNFTGATAVAFGAVNAATFAVVNATTITAQVPVGASTGKISVTTPQGTATSVADFFVGASPPPVLTATPPSISGLITSAGTASASTNYSLVASNLTGNLVIGPTTSAFEISTNGTSWATNLTLPQTGGSLSNTIFVRLSAGAVAGSATAAISNSIAGSGTSLTNLPTLSGLVEPAGTPGLIYWSFNRATPSSGVPSGWVVEPLSSGNNMATTALFESVSVSSGYTNPFGVAASGSTNAALAAVGGALNTATNAYYEVRIAPTSSSSITNISFGARSTSSGPQAYAIRSSADNFATDLATGTLVNNSAWVMNVNAPVAVALSNGTNILRIYGYNGTNVSGTAANWRIDDLTLAVGNLGPQPVITVSTNALSGFSASQGVPSGSQSFNVSGENLSAGISVAAPANFEVSLTSGGTYSSSVLVPQTGGSAAITPVFIRIASTAPAGAVSGSVSVTSTGATTQNVTVSGNVASGPAVTMTPPALTGFDTPQGVPSTNQSVTVSGTNLSGDIVVSAPNGYEISTNGTTFASALTLPVTGGVLVPTTVASDNATNAAYSGGWTNGANGGTGFGPWTISVDNNPPAYFAGAFIGDPNFAGITGFGTNAFGLYANPANTAATVSVDRPFLAPLKVGETLSFQWAVNFDAGDGNKGFNLYAGGTGGSQLLNVNQGNFPGNITFNGANAITNYGTGPMRWTFTMTATNNLQVTSTARDGSTNIVFTTNISLSGRPDSLRWYTTAMTAGDQRQPYFNNLNIAGSTLTGGSVAPTTVFVRIGATTPQGPVSGLLSATTAGATQPVQVNLSGNVSPPTDSYDIWAASYGLIGPSGDRTADPDGDGFANVSEYAFGTNPTAPTSSLWELRRVAGLLEMTFLARSGVLYQVQSTADLASQPWLPDPSAVVSTIPGGSPPYERRRFVADISQAGSKRFYRVVATVPVAGALLVAPSQLLPLETFLGQPSAARTFQFTAANLGDSSVTIQPPPDFQISTNGTSFTGSPIVFSPAQLSNVPPPIHVRATGALLGSFTNQVQLTSSGSGPSYSNSVTVIAEVVREPVITASVASLPRFYTAQNTASVSQSFTLGGSNLIGSVQVEAPAGFSVSTNNTSFASALTVNSTNGALGPLPVFVRLNGTALGDVAGNLQLSSSRAQGRTVALSGRVSAAATPALFVTGTNALTPFETSVGRASVAQAFGIGGSGLGSSLTVSAPTGFEVSLNEAGTYTNTLSITPSGGTLNQTDVFLRLAGTALGTWQGTVSVGLSAPLVQQTFGVTGTVFPVPQISVVPQLSTNGFQTFVALPSDPDQEAASAPQQVVAGAVGLLTNLVVRAPAGFEVSSDAGRTYGMMITLPRSVQGEVAATPLLVRMKKSETDGPKTGQLTFESSLAQTVSLPLSGIVFSNRPLITVPLATVANTGNSAAVTPGGAFGKVDYPYQIGKYEITLADYAQFLNAVAATPTQPHITALYNSYMGNTNSAVSAAVAGISRTGSGTTADPYVYTVIGSGNRPVTFVNWFMAARFVNWLSNGGQVGSDPDTGSYQLLNQTTATAANPVPSRNAVNPNTGLPPIWFLPSEDEWVKGAYYDAAKVSTNSTNAPGGYWLYPTMRDTPPRAALPTPPGTTPAANYGRPVDSPFLAPVGSYTNSPSYYGTFDQAGNVAEWNDLKGESTMNRGVRGGGWTAATTTNTLSLNWRNETSPTIANDATGFRLVRGSGLAGSSTSFFVSVQGVLVEVRRYGTGSRGLIFFSNTGDMAADIRAVPVFPFTSTLAQGNYSMFLWSYPNVAPFTQTGSSIDAWFGDPNAIPPIPPQPATRLAFPGVAKAVADQIRAQNPDLTSVCLVGNSLGAGIVLQGYNELVTDPTVRFVLVAPTEVFLPPISGLPSFLARTVMASNPANDIFFATPVDIAYITANAPSIYWPSGYIPGSSWAHWIIPFQASMPYVFDLVNRAYLLSP